MTVEPDPVASEAEVIEAFVVFSRPVTRSKLERVLAGRVGARLLRTRLATLVRDGRLRKFGDRRWTTYALGAEAHDVVGGRYGPSCARLHRPAPQGPVPTGSTTSVTTATG